MSTRDDAGKFVKGKSGNPSGRPKKASITAGEAKTFASLVRSNDMDGIMEFLISKSSDVADLSRIVKDFMQYKVGKKTNVTSETKEDKTLTILFRMEGTESGTPVKLPMPEPTFIDVTPEEVE